MSTDIIHQHNFVHPSWDFSRVVSMLTKKYLLLNSLLPLCVQDTFAGTRCRRSHLRSTVGPAQFRNWKFKWILTTELLAEWWNSGSDPKLFDFRKWFKRTQMALHLQAHPEGRKIHKRQHQPKKHTPSLSTQVEFEALEDGKAFPSWDARS